MNFRDHILLTVVLCLLSFKLSIAQDAAALNCLQVHDDGSVTLHWTPIEDSPVFVKYVINYSTTGGTYIEVAEITDLSQNQFTHLTANAASRSRYYFITTVYSNIWFDSQTLQTIFLQVDNTDPAFAKLVWNPVGNPLPDGSSEYYQILKEYPQNTWTLIDSATGTSYDDPIIVCSDTITYQLVISSKENNCNSVSNVRGGWFKDENYPAIPVFDSVSINEDDKPILGWTLSTSPDVTGYIIYRFENDAWTEISRIQESTATFYIDNEVDPCYDIYSYAIAAIDSCGNKSEGTFEVPRKTILLDEVVNNVCGGTNSLSWSPYEGSVPDLEGYKIFYSEDGGPFSQVGETDPDSLTFVHKDVETGVAYTYYVQAVFGDKSSSSCKKSVTTSTYQKPSSVYLANADVLPTYQIELTVDVDTMVYDCTWEIWRSDTNQNNLQFIKSISRSELNGFPLKYTDSTADAWAGYYNYQVKVLDSCGRESLESNTLKTIFLGASILDESNIHLQWNEFEGWDAGVEQYYIFRMVNGVEPTFPIDSVTSATLDYTDNISSVGGSSVPVLYWVQAVENIGNENAYLEKSNSNRVGAALESDMIVANAYRPGIDAIEFKPVYRFFSGTDYLFQIFNRWGQLIFETNNPDAGWDGKHEGSFVPLGTYIYNLGYKNLDASSVSKKGTVTVIY